MVSVPGNIHAASWFMLNEKFKTQFIVSFFQSEPKLDVKFDLYWIIDPHRIEPFTHILLTNSSSCQRAVFFYVENYHCYALGRIQLLGPTFNWD